MQNDYSNKAKFLRYLAGQVQLREGAPAAERVLRAIFDHAQDPGADALTERVLARIARLPVPIIVAIRRELEQAEVVEPGLSIQMTPAARSTLAEGWGWQPPEQAAFVSPSARPSQPAASPSPGPQASQLCQACAGTGILPSGPQWDAVLSGLQKHFLGKPRRVPAGGKARNQPTVETNLRRTALLHEYGALAGKDVLVLGEDVTLAAGIALAGRALSPSGKLARRLVALHADEKVLRQLRDIAVSEGLIIGLVTHDIRRQLMPDLQGEFSTVFIEPPQTYEGVMVALSRAVDAVNEEGLIFLSFSSEQTADLLEVQRTVAEMGLIVAQVMAGFDHYSTGTRDLYVLRVTDDTLPLIEGDYTGEIVGERQTYACTKCGRQLSIGGDATGRFASLADLEQAGCPTCGNRTFRLIEGHARGGNGDGEG